MVFHHFNFMKKKYFNLPFLGTAGFLKSFKNVGVLNFNKSIVLLGAVALLSNNNDSFAQANGYCVPTNNLNTIYYITGVSTEGGETNFSNLGTGFSGYTNYSAEFSASTYPGGSFAVTATHPANQAYLYKAWVDWNRDFTFSANEEVLNTGELYSPAFLGNLIVPVDTEYGSYRLRIRNVFSGVPLACGEHVWGEAEDYTINVIDLSGCFPPYGLNIRQDGDSAVDIAWNAPILGVEPTGYEFVVSSSPNPPAGNGEFTTDVYSTYIAIDPTASAVYLYVRSVCAEGVYSAWQTTTILDSNAPQFLEKNIVVAKEANAISITSGGIQVTDVSIYDVRGTKLYSQNNINASKTVISGLQIQRQVVIVEVNTVKGKVSKRIVF